MSAALADGHGVVALDRTAPGTDGSPPLLARPSTPHTTATLTRITADIADYQALRDAIDGCDALIHLAALIAPGHLPDAVVHDHNVVTNYHALLAAGQAGIERVCQASSVNAIGGRFSRTARYDYFPIDERHPTYAEDPYSLSKWIGEQQGDAIVRRYPNTSAVSLRFHGVVEQRCEAVAWNGSMPDAVARQLWGYTNLHSAAQACLAALRADLDGHHVCYVVADETTSDVPSLELSRRHYPDVPIRGDLDDHRSFFDCSTTTALLGWRHEPIAEGSR